MADLADLFGCSQWKVRSWAREPGFPASLGFRPNPHGRGPAPEVWDSRAVARWKKARDVERARQRAEERKRLIAGLRQRRATGVRLRDIADEYGVSYSFVQRATAGVISRPPGWRSARGRTDDELLAALRASGARTVYQYDRWHHRADGVQPSSAAIIARFGSWREALDAAGRR